MMMVEVPYLDILLQRFYKLNVHFENWLFVDKKEKRENENMSHSFRLLLFETHLPFNSILIQVKRKKYLTSFL
jgi:hypothetical protein